MFSEFLESIGVIIVRDEVDLLRISMDLKYKDIIVVYVGELFRIDVDIYGKLILII